MKRAVLFMTLLFLQGCTSIDVYKSYEGELSTAERAHLRGNVNSASESCEVGEPIVLFSAIDGRPTPRFMTSYTNGCQYPSEAFLRPGKRNVEALYSYGSSPRYLYSCFVAEAGKEYKTEVVVRGYSTHLLILEVRSQEGKESYTPAQWCHPISNNATTES